MGGVGRRRVFILNGARKHPLQPELLGSALPRAAAAPRCSPDLCRPRQRWRCGSVFSAWVSPSPSLKAERNTAKSEQGRCCAFTLPSGLARASSAQSIPALKDKSLWWMKNCMNVTCGSCTLNTDIQRPKITGPSSPYCSYTSHSPERHCLFAVHLRVNFLLSLPSGSDLLDGEGLTMLPLKTEIRGNQVMMSLVSVPSTC